MQKLVLGLGAVVVAGGALVAWRIRSRTDSSAPSATPAPAGPTIERYGSAEPWPWDRFAP